MQRCPPIFINDVDVCPCLDEHIHTLVMTFKKCVMDGCISITDVVNVSTCLDQNPYASIISIIHGMMKCRDSSIVDGVKICPRIYEKLHTCFMVLKNCSMEGCASRHICDIGVGICFDDFFQTNVVTISYCSEYTAIVIHCIL
ncbi:hypothetical protein NY2A_b881R [Paramecium bursaria Chlorella virus NY2A]|uniref:Uncharacterized protein b881R n=1 Tax=Paramecium bursaria Chlorella virus NY2A TaxID=46021 RepID=A7IY56_PBCVN|nr:hypothetical protein NY2A_b881R [Paramecium bursaria Chlorella virus NY2A]ABT15280.1 hypothetical protein NY2A_b881R [Paramecium bursaria Chlorella virus NY2A]